MAIPTPDRGQPIDVTYLYDVATEINKISSQISDANYNYTTVNMRDVGSKTIPTRSAKIVAGYKDVAINQTVRVGDSLPFTFDFGTYFQYPPIATATIMNTGTSDISDDVIVSIRTITTSQLTGVLKFNRSGTATAAINVIAIGIPQP